MVYMYHSFHVLAMINSAAMNIGVHVSLSVLVSSVCMPSSRIAGSYASSISSFFKEFPHLRNLYAGQEATVRTGHKTTDWFQTGKGVRQGCILSPYFFILYAEYIMRNAGLDETHAGIKTAGRNIYNLKYADEITFMAESEELKSLLMKVKEESEKLA